MIGQATKDNTLLCVYGTLKTKERAFHLIDGKCLFEGITWIPGFIMVNLGSFPGIIKQKKEPGKDEHFICSEVFTIQKALLATLDEYEGAPHFYHREIVNTPYGLGWIYVLPAKEQYLSLPIVEPADWTGNINKAG